MGHMLASYVFWAPSILEGQVHSHRNRHVFYVHGLPFMSTGP